MLLKDLHNVFKQLSLSSTSASLKSKGTRSAFIISGSMLFNLYFETCLVLQITTLVNHREVSKRSERTCRAIERIGQAVSLAVERFVNVGEALAEEHEDLRDEMFQACQEARLAGN